MLLDAPPRIPLLHRNGKKAGLSALLFPSRGPLLISLAPRICVSEGRGKARSRATPRPSRLVRPPRSIPAQVRRGALRANRAGCHDIYDGTVGGGSCISRGERR